MRIQNEELLRLNNSQRNLIKSKEEEIEKTKKLYDNRIETMQKSFRDDEVLLKEKHNDRIGSIQNEQLDALDNYYKDFLKEKGRLDNEKEVLTKAHKSNLHDIKINQEEEIKDIYTKADEIVKETQNSVQEYLVNSDYKIKDRLRSITAEGDARVNQLEKSTHQKMRNIERDKDLELRKDQVDFMARMNEIKMNHQKDIHELEKENFRHMESKQMINDNLVKGLDSRHTELIKQKNASFNQKYNALENAHNEVLKRVQEKFIDEIQKLSTKYSSYKDNVVKRGDDSFYQVNMLSPEVEDKGKYYNIFLAVPEHEKDNVHLSVNNRDVKISFNRRFGETITSSEDGSVNSTKRSDLYIKDFKVADIVNPDKISQKYDLDNNQIIFKVEKL